MPPFVVILMPEFYTGWMLPIIKVLIYFFHVKLRDILFQNPSQHNTADGVFLIRLLNNTGLEKYYKIDIEAPVY